MSVTELTKPAPSSMTTGVQPLWAVEGGRVTITGTGFNLEPRPPEVRFASIPARLTHASTQALTAIVPSGLDGGHTPIRVEGAPGQTAYVEIGAPIATGLHQVDNPAFDRDGNLFVTFSGSRGHDAPVSIYVVRPDGTREPYASGVPNPTSMVVGPDGALYVSSRFDGSVLRIEPGGGAVTSVATDLGVACGVAFGPDGHLYVGDRSGSILRVTGQKATQVAALPPSVAAFHLAFGPDGWLYVSAPTLSPCDVLYRVSLDGVVETFSDGFGRPQGLAFDAEGNLFVVDAVAGSSALYRLRPGRPEKERVLSGGALLGLAFAPGGGMVVCSSETVYRLDVGIRGLLPLPASSAS